MSGCFGNSGGPDDVWQREEKGGGEARLFKLAKLADKQSKFLCSSEQDCQMKEDAFMNVG